MTNPLVTNDAQSIRKLKIILCARSVFIELGFSGASMSTIATRVGGSKATLYNYFPSKEALFFAVVQYECSRKFVEIFDESYPISEDLLTVLRRLGHRYVSTIISEENMVFTRLLISEVGRHPQLGEAFYDSGPRKSQFHMAAYIETQIASGRLKLRAPIRFVQQFFDLCLGQLFLKRVMNITIVDLDSQITGNVEFALEAMRKLYPQIEYTCQANLRFISRGRRGRRNSA